MKQNKNLEILKSIKDKKLNKEEKAKIWNIAIGLQAVDKLKPSKYLKYLIQEYLEEKISLNSIEEIIEKNYILNEISEEEFECDLVSTRIVSLILNNEFKLSTQFYTEMHKYLFNKIYVFAGKLRKVNISNPEEILNNDTVEYQPFDLIEKTLK